MKRLHLLSYICALLAIMFVASCNDYETYAEKKDKEKAAINAFIASRGIQPITEEKFEKQGFTTDTARNEYVKFDNSGIYLQIVRKGAGEQLPKGESAVLMCRYTEYNILGDSLQTSNLNQTYAPFPEELTIKRTGDEYSGTFSSSYGLMNSCYGSYAPMGWLVPLRYINIGKQVTSEVEIAKVRVIVPAEQGHQYASANVTPFHYEITYQRK